MSFGGHICIYVYMYLRMKLLDHRRHMFSFTLTVKEISKVCSHLPFNSNAWDFLWLQDQVLLRTYCGAVNSTH